MKPSNPRAFDVTNLATLAHVKRARKGGKATYKPEHSLDFGQGEDREVAQKSLDRFYNDQALSRPSRA
jgi:hypothetical protein